MPAIPAKDSPWTQLLVGRAAGAPAAAGVGAGEAAAAVEEATPAQIETAVREVNAGLESRSISLQFEIDQETDKVIVKVVDQTNGVVIRQIPTEEVVRIAKVMGKAPGLLMSQQA
ncbi:flagellar protein FlaG [Variovorax saccharolyticus]|uniref:flagellar protein FlaG n=1 Tax=Variovorax saccharolyticus TaxID=3053516 RepID=UPI002577F1B8|nr:MULTISPECIES: flagellar protein FlaG [unclassified Variovorax]MDM0021297.1 flagellar protein FlaG [Variovorax sp. J22R187]